MCGRHLCGKGSENYEDGATLLVSSILEDCISETKAFRSPPMTQSRRMFALVVSVPSISTHY